MTGQRLQGRNRKKETRGREGQALGRAVCRGLGLREPGSPRPERLTQREGVGQTQDIWRGRERVHGARDASSRCGFYSECEYQNTSLVPGAPGFHLGAPGKHQPAGPQPSPPPEMKIPLHFASVIFHRHVLCLIALPALSATCSLNLTFPPRTEGRDLCSINSRDRSFEEGREPGVFPAAWLLHAKDQCGPRIQ